MHVGVIQSRTQVKQIILGWDEHLVSDGIHALLDSGANKFKVFALSEKRLFPQKQPVKVKKGCVTWVRFPSLCL